MRDAKFWLEAKEILDTKDNLNINFAHHMTDEERSKLMAEETLQEKLIREFMDPRWFGDPHDFAARAEIESLQKRVKELEQHTSATIESGISQKHAKGEKGSITAKVAESQSE